MPPEARKLLQDIITAADAIHQFTNGLSLEQYAGNEMCRAAVERKFEIIGEACCRLRDKHALTFSELKHGPHIIALRSRVIHGYDSVDDAILWDVIGNHLPSLLGEVQSLIK